MPHVLGRRVPSSSLLSIDAAATTSGSTTSLEVEQLRVDIMRAVRSVCPRWLADHADDLAQVAMCRLLDRIRTTDGTIAMTPGYLYRTAHSVVVDEIRRRRRLHEIPLEPDVPTQHDERTPERQAFSREVRNAITGCLARLETSRRRAVTLHLLGHSVDEIGAQLECRYKQADNLVYRGLSSLRACLRKRGVKA